MTRVCGADVERDRRGQPRCWCNGLFCGKGGARASTQFRRALHTTKTASTREQFLDLIAQVDLFQADEARATWLQRLEKSRVSRV